ncbi:YwaF family protein [Virgibacillus litoralis]|uniref:Integral membrane protein (TIGR02206 family) n=1 Tax=Virgibacillus litoralis TaxID=578221 RepID=A0ABS4HJ77_9BACI|nr:TIGR02206 family membrane protein [Virgibacillus litoralis]MBP1950965.1 putative integral membrane protein (TIGR02206 family) [Virgibacillus litoralis]
MWNWLSLGGKPFITFGTSHIIMLLIYFIGIVIFILFLKKILTDTSLYNIVRWSLFGLLILSEVSYQTWTAVNGIWSLREHTPLHLCGIAGITGAIALVTHNRKLIQVTFFIGLIPALLALITPELPYDVPHYRFWKFFIHHTAISWTSIFLVATSSLKIHIKSLLETFGYLLLYAIIIGFIINPFLDSNYLYLSHTPTATTPLDVLGSGIWYYVNLCGLAFTVFFIQLQIYKLIRRKKSTLK